MRIVSLVPSATEMLFALGLGSEIVAVTHECDYPPDALKLPRITRDVLPSGLTSAQMIFPSLRTYRFSSKIGVPAASVSRKSVIRSPDPASPAYVMSSKRSASSSAAE